MFVVVAATVFLVGLVNPSLGHAIESVTCGQEFQEHIQKAISAKLKCSSAVFSDCCQVRSKV